MHEAKQNILLVGIQGLGKIMGNETADKLANTGMCVNVVENIKIRYEITIHSKQINKSHFNLT